MLFCAGSAWSDGGRVVVVDPDPRVLDAIDVALSPWNLRVRRVPGPIPLPDMGAASAAAHAIADSERAGAVVWVAPPTAVQTASLWVYDAETEQLVVRPLSVAAPFDDAGAAAVALTVKTLLRGSTLEPSASPPAAAPSPPSPPPAPPSPVAGTPNVVTPTASTRTTSAPEIAAHDVLHETGAIWRLEAVVGGRAPTGASAVAEPQAALGVSVWPASLHGHVGAGIVVQAGPGVAIENPEFNGQFTQAEIVITARARAAEGRVAFEFQAGPSLRLTSLDGAGLETSLPVHAVRLNPAFDLGAIFDVALGARVAVGALLNGSSLFRFQRYTVNRAQLFDEPLVDLLFGARLAVEVD